MPKENPSAQTARMFVALFPKHKERKNEQSESGFSVSTEEITIKIQKISKNGQRESKLNVISENIPLNFHNIKTKITCQETTTKTKTSHLANVIRPFNVYHQNIQIRGKTVE
jgi:hypothetical protein